MQFLNSSAMAHEILAALSAKATGLFLAPRKPFTREREACGAPPAPPPHTHPPAPAKEGPWRERDKEVRPGGTPRPHFLWGLFSSQSEAGPPYSSVRLEGRKGALVAALPILPARVPGQS